jgi:hypothetical protein
MILIPLQPIASQSLTVTLAGQSTRIDVYQKSSFLYTDIVVDGRPIQQGRMALNAVRLVRHAYLGFIGDLAFVDMQGTTDPVWTGLGSRYQLVYLTAADLTTQGFSA